MTGVVLATFVGQAGEPIIIPGEKQTTPPPALDRKVPLRDAFRLGDKLNSPSGFDVLTVPMIPNSTPLAPKEHRRRQLERLEREHWMAVGKGELQAEEDKKNFLNDSPESPDTEVNRENLLFRGLDKNGNQRPGSSKEPLRPPGARPGDDDEEESKDTPRLLRDDKEGTHTTELNFNKLFEPRQENDSLTPKFNKSDLTLQRLLNGGVSPEARRELQTSREEFRNFLDNRGSAPPLAGPSDPINFGTDFTKQPVNPTTAQPLGGGNPSVANRFGAPLPAARPGSPLGGGFPTAFAGAPGPAGFSAAPLLAPRTEPVRPMKQMTFDPPRRKF